MGLWKPHSMAEKIARYELVNVNRENFFNRENYCVKMQHPFVDEFVLKIPCF